MKEHILKTSTEVIKKSEAAILNVNQLDISYVEKMLGRLNGTAIDFGDIYFQKIASENWGMSESKVKEASFSINQGMGVRGVSFDRTALAYSDEINERALHQTVRAARSISKLQGSGQAAINRSREYPILTTQGISAVDSISREKKVLIMHDMDNFARSLDSRVKNVHVSITLTDATKLVFNTEGVIGADYKPKVTIFCSVMVEGADGTCESGSCSIGRSSGLDYFFENVPVLPKDYIHGVSIISNNGLTERRYLYIARDAVRQALLNLEARPQEAGMMPVILAAGWPAVLIHEAVGHGLEADAIRKSESVFAGMVGKQVASPLCTVIDDGTIEGGNGTNSIDSEGTPSKRNVLIENGILRGYMYDKLNANIMHKPLTGNGRRMSYTCIPIPRMTNTCLLPGKSTPEEIISSVKKGIYAVNFSGGQVDPATGKFTFSACEAYAIEDGHIAYPVKGATLIGSGMEVMKNVSMIGNNLELDHGCGTCGKLNQSVAVGIGQPTLKIDQVTVGGTK